MAAGRRPIGETPNWPSERRTHDEAKARPNRWRLETICREGAGEHFAITCREGATESAPSQRTEVDIDHAAHGLEKTNGTVAMKMKHRFCVSSMPNREIVQMTSVTATGTLRAEEHQRPGEAHIEQRYEPRIQKVRR